ncbi:PHP domain-containing protein [Syntrophomonas erecta]
MLYDLHVHTTASDGLLTPQEVLDAAHELGLKGVAITDHDTVSGLPVAFQHLKSYYSNLVLIPGIEMNTEIESIEVHILGYFIDYYYPGLSRRLEEIQQARRQRAYKMINRLNSMGLNIKIQQVEKFAKGESVGRPHVAMALIEEGYVFSIEEAFDRYLGIGKPAYIPRYKFLPQEAISLIKQAGGVPVLAHPGLIDRQNITEKIIKMGIRGIEVYYPEHTPDQVKKLLVLSEKHGLVVTGGSDFHGSGESRGRLGCTGIKHQQMLALEAIDK